MARPLDLRLRAKRKRALLRVANWQMSYFQSLLKREVDLRFRSDQYVAFAGRVRWVRVLNPSAIFGRLRENSFRGLHALMNATFRPPEMRAKST